MAKNPDKRAEAADLVEFGDHELAGAPSIAALIGALPEDQREAYRSERRAKLVEICAAQGLPLRTWREYFTSSETPPAGSTDGRPPASGGR